MPSEQTNLLEQVLEGQASSEEKESISEAEIKGELEEATLKTKETGKGKEVKAEKEKALPPDLESRIQAEADKRAQSYQEKREADTALIRSLQSQVKELRSEKSAKGLSKAMEAILAGDEEEGIEPDKTEQRKKYFGEIKELIKEYNEKSAEIKEVAALASEFANKVDKRVADNFNLFDSNPAIRAKGAIEAISDAIHFISERAAFNKVLEEIPLLKNGEEVRKQIDSFVERYMELSDQKGKDLLINQLKQEFRITPRKKPPAPSDGSGGSSLPKLGAKTDTRALLRQGFNKEK